MIMKIDGSHHGEKREGLAWIRVWSPRDHRDQNLVSHTALQACTAAESQR